MYDKSFPIIKETIKILFVSKKRKHTIINLSITVKSYNDSLGLVDEWITVSWGVGFEIYNRDGQGSDKNSSFCHMNSTI